MINLEKKTAELNILLKTGDLNNLHLFENIYKDLIEDYVDTNYHKESNLVLIRNAYKVIVLLYGSNSDLDKLNDLVNENLKSQKILEEFSALNIDGKISLEEKNEILNWFKNDYYMGFDNHKRTSMCYRYSYVSRFLAQFTLITFCRMS